MRTGVRPFHSNMTVRAMTIALKAMSSLGVALQGPTSPRWLFDRVVTLYLTDVAHRMVFVHGISVG